MSLGYRGHKEENQMTKDDQALLKYSVIAPFINGTSGCSSIRAFSQDASAKQYFHNGEYVTFDKETIRKWIRTYRKEGYEGLKRKTRNDNLKSKSFDDDLMIRIDDLKTQFPKMRATALYDKLISEGYFEPGDISVRTFQRFVRNKNYVNLNESNERRAFTFEYPNDSWQTDTTHGPYIVIKGKKYKTYIIVFIDDHSRLVVGAKAYFHDNAENMQELMKESIKKYGVPKQIYADNGGPYTNKQLAIICARIGIQLKNARPYDPESKGKVERFNRTLKDRWMNWLDWNQINGIDDLNTRLEGYIRTYNNTQHKSLNMTPNDCYFKDSEKIRYLDEETLKRDFYHTVTRKVNKIGNVRIENRIYEVDYEMRGKTIEFTYDPSDPSVIYVEDKSYKILDSVSNSKKRRKKNVDYSKIVNKENEDVLEYEAE